MSGLELRKIRTPGHGQLNFAGCYKNLWLLLFFHLAYYSLIDMRQHAVWRLQERISRVFAYLDQPRRSVGEQKLILSDNKRKCFDRCFGKNIKV